MGIRGKSTKKRTKWREGIGERGLERRMKRKEYGTCIIRRKDGRNIDG
jgi:hypothetical protein